METTGTWPLQGRLGGWGCGGKATPLCDRESVSADKSSIMFSGILFLASKMSMCCKLFITLWWWKNALAWGRGGSTGQWGMTGMWMGEMIDRMNAESAGEVLLWRGDPPHTHTHSNNLSEVKHKHKSASPQMLSQHHYKSLRAKQQGGHMKATQSNPINLVIIQTKTLVNHLLYFKIKKLQRV